nr:glycine-rich RNA-binding protein-like [Ipomoea batatas]
MGHHRKLSPDALSSFGEVLESNTGRSRGFGFVTFKDEQPMSDAIKGMNCQSLDGRNITVNEAQSRGIDGRGGCFRGGRREGGGDWGYGRRNGGYGGGGYGHRDGGYSGGGYSRDCSRAGGTYIFIFVGCGSAIVDREKELTMVGIALAWGLPLMALIYTLGHVSGAHFNPCCRHIMLIEDIQDIQVLDEYSWDSAIVGKTFGGLNSTFKINEIVDLVCARGEVSWGEPPTTCIVWKLSTTKDPKYDYDLIRSYYNKGHECLLKIYNLSIPNQNGTFVVVSEDFICHMGDWVKSNTPALNDQKHWISAIRNTSRWLNRFFKSFHTPSAVSIHSTALAIVGETALRIHESTIVLHCSQYIAGFKMLRMHPRFYVGKHRQLLLDFVIKFNRALSTSDLKLWQEVSESLKVAFNKMDANSGIADERSMWYQESNATDSIKECIHHRPDKPMSNELKDMIRGLRNIATHVPEHGLKVDFARICDDIERFRPNCWTALHYAAMLNLPGMSAYDLNAKHAQNKDKKGVPKEIHALVGLNLIFRIDVPKEQFQNLHNAAFPVMSILDDVVMIE